MSIQKTFTCHNPAGTNSNEEAYCALALAIIDKTISVDEAIFKITGKRPLCETSTHRADRAPKGTIKSKIIELYNEDQTLTYKDIAIKLDCSEEMVRYTVQKKYKKDDQQKIADYIRDNPLKSTQEIADTLGISYQKALRHIKKHYAAEQLELPFGIKLS